VWYASETFYIWNFICDLFYMKPQRHQYVTNQYDTKVLKEAQAVWHCSSITMMNSKKTSNKPLMHSHSHFKLLPNTIFLMWLYLMTSTIHSSNFAYLNVHHNTTCGTILKFFFQIHKCQLLPQFLQKAPLLHFFKIWKWHLWYLFLDIPHLGYVVSHHTLGLAV